MSSHDNHVYVRSQTEFEYLKRKRRENMRTQVTTFSIMIFLTLISFTAVVADFSKYYIIPIILLLAAVQVVLQLYYFMHMSEKNHNIPAYFIYFAAMVGFTFLLTFITIVWW
ncbi:MULTISPECIES: cytochrome c oxidase subunit IVB [unclassified Psychrobacillus]|uniref:cytochrome c oxidase subunit IVB n=1 Tax=unclassified Psychrobacillus TaxID=2636677 RepID=UPI00146E25A6|nr:MULTISPECIES: cytochrome c oxidase subunit IVB [unclassified Psychrobacillus]MCM3357073.1 cytochrome c oxidase subunit IVB [Psychrobacillus sp. MER TA 171]NME05202.1 cytochrome c oxidase subunit IVB [Psychrobacillus sp. BL-248-WT-3]